MAAPDPDHVFSLSDRLEELGDLAGAQAIRDLVAAYRSWAGPAPEPVVRDRALLQAVCPELLATVLDWAAHHRRVIVVISAEKDHDLMILRMRLGYGGRSIILNWICWMQNNMEWVRMWIDRYLAQLISTD